MPDAFSIAFALSAACLSIAVAVSTLEYLMLLPAFDSDGAFSWEILGTRSAPPSVATFRRFREALMGRRGVAVILLVRLVCVIALAASLIAVVGSLSVLALGGMLLTGMLMNYRCPFGLDGSDHMSNIVSAGLLVASVPAAPGWHIAGFGFIAFQSCLSYGTAGVTKAVSPVWRNGTALHKIMNTGTYGHQWLSEVLRNRVLGYLLCWLVIVFEVTLPLALFLPLKPMLVVFAVGCAFHAGIAVFMGLNTFLWSFLAGYPAIWVCSHYVQRLLA